MVVSPFVRFLLAIITNSLRVVFCLLFRSFVTSYLYRFEALCFIRYVYFFFGMILLFGCLCHLCLLDVKDYQNGIVKQECDEKKKYNLSVLHGLFI